MNSLISSPIAQGLIALFAGAACIALTLVKGLPADVKGALLAAGLSALTYGGSRLGVSPTETKVKEIKAEARETAVALHQAVAENTEKTDAAAEAARLAAEAAVKRDMRH